MLWNKCIVDFLFVGLVGMSIIEFVGLFVASFGFAVDGLQRSTQLNSIPLSIRKSELSFKYCLCNAPAGSI